MSEKDLRTPIRNDVWNDLIGIEIGQAKNRSSLVKKWGEDVVDDLIFAGHLEAEGGRVLRTKVSVDAASLWLLVPEDGSAIGNQRARAELGWKSERRYERAKASLLATSEIAIGRGRGGSIRLARGIEMEGVGSESKAPTTEAARPSVLPSAGSRTTKSKRGSEPTVSSATNDSAIAQQGLEARLWKAANALRGPVDPADFKTYVFPMLFWKWISDAWAQERSEAVEEYGDELTDEIEADFHRFELPEGTRWSQVTVKVSNLGAEIAKAFQRIEKANPRSLAGVFGDASWGNQERLPESALLGLIKAFNEIRLDPSTVSHDLLGAGYEYLLKNFADESGKKAGEFFTPREVVNLIVGVLQPEPDESVYDPTCGSGGMLVSTINNVREQGKDHRTLRVYGQEINLTTSSIARMNLFLHEIEDFDIKRGDTLRAPAFKEKNGSMRQFDAVIANPPFSLSDWGADRWPADPRAFCGVPPAKSGDYAFIQHMISSMKPGSGRVGVVMPHGVLFRGGAEARIRECLIEKDLLDAVIGLPPNLFYSTSIPACILVFRDQKQEERRNHVLFVDGSARFVKGKNQNRMSDEDVKVLVEAYETGDDPDGEGGTNVRLVPFDEIKSNGFDLNIGRYIKVAAEETADLGTALVAYADARQKRIEAEAEMFKRLGAAGIDLSTFEVSSE